MNANIEENNNNNEPNTFLYMNNHNTISLPENIFSPSTNILSSNKYLQSAVLSNTSKGFIYLNNCVAINFDDVFTRMCINAPEFNIIEKNLTNINKNCVGFNNFKIKNTIMNYIHSVKITCGDISILDLNMQMQNQGRNNDQIVYNELNNYGYLSLNIFIKNQDMHKLKHKTLKIYYDEIYSSEFISDYIKSQFMSNNIQLKYGDNYYVFDDVFINTVENGIINYVYKYVGNKTKVSFIFPMKCNNINNINVHVNGYNASNNNVSITLLLNKKIISNDVDDISSLNIDNNAIVKNAGNNNRIVLLNKDVLGLLIKINNIISTRKNNIDIHFDAHNKLFNYY